MPDRPAATAARIARQFPGSSVWYGETTKRWWAVVPCLDGRFRLVEAVDPEDLIQAIKAAQSRM